MIKGSSKRMRNFADEPTGQHIGMPILATYWHDGRDHSFVLGVESGQQRWLVEIGIGAVDLDFAKANPSPFKVSS